MKFYAIDKQGNYWESNPAYCQQKLAQLCDGTMVVLTDMLRKGWEVGVLAGYEYTEVSPPKTEVKTVEKTKCPYCRGSGTVMEIVDHDNDGAVYESFQCGGCYGTGRVVVKS